MKEITLDEKINLIDNKLNAIASQCFAFELEIIMEESNKNEKGVKDRRKTIAALETAYDAIAAYREKLTEAQEV